MKLKKTMKEFYARDMRRLPGIGLPQGETPVREETAHEVSLLRLHLAFNGAAAAIVLLAVVTHFTFGSPLAEVLQRVNQKYSVDVAVREGLERIPADFKRYMKGGSS